MSRKRVGGESEPHEVVRSGGQRGKGAPALYAFGYADFAEILGESPWSVAGAVVDEVLDPLSFVELAVAREHGLDRLRSIAKDERQLWRTLIAARPTRVREVARVRCSPACRPYGLSDLWAISHADIAAQTRREPQDVWNAQKSERLVITDLVTIVDYVVEHLPEKQAAKLGLQL